MVQGTYELWIDGQFKQDYIIRECAVAVARVAHYSGLYTTVTLFDPKGNEVELRSQAWEERAAS